ncbi:MAG: hypothetical protein N2561_03145 [Bacteroidetes bacterium]|nr:hypothetical protein [Rhodothermia bacterium]MCS7155656.1 hypothetical protein [Bacteroidota bacterium]MCX7906515.1 hypothetical protein [Bacteroidota bacterium]MDW8137204.1 hypothetical protein [Bacteroidota bacterium]MDW8284926.1 hypothetical protein [Bacteroidota bacterium]
MRRYYWLLLALFGGLGCGLFGHRHDEDHAEAEGLLLRIGAQEVVRVWDARVTGSLSVRVGQELGPIEVYFLDENQRSFQPDPSEYRLQLNVANSAIASVRSGSSWTFYLRGLAAGQTSLEIVLLHGGHADFRTPAIPVTVAP